MNSHTVTDTFWAKIYVGFKERKTGKNVGSFNKARKICQKYADEVSYCVSIKKVEYCYCEGRERGVEIGLINYPRFPEPPSLTQLRALELAAQLKTAFKQLRVTVVMPEKTIMLGDNN